MSIMGYWQSRIKESGYPWGRRKERTIPWGDKDEMPSPRESNPVIGHCPKCGLELHGMMMYCCSRHPCPSGLGSNISM